MDLQDVQDRGPGCLIESATDLRRGHSVFNRRCYAVLNRWVTSATRLPNATAVCRSPGPMLG